MAETGNGPLQAFAICWACEECGEQMSRAKDRKIILTADPPLFPHSCANGHTANLRDSYPRVAFRPVQPESA